MPMFSNRISSRPSYSLSRFLSRFLSLDHSHGGNIEDDWELIVDRELATSEEREDMFSKGHENDDQSDDGFYNFRSLPPSNSSNKAKYTILSKAELRQRLEDKIKEVSTVLMLSKNDAAILLKRFKWDVNRTTEEWLAFENKVREAVGLFARPVVEIPATGTDEITCTVCQTKFPACTVRSVSCGHQICFYCWENYISEAVNEGPRCLSLQCPLLSCDAAVGPIFIEFEFLSSDDDKKKFEDHLLRSYLAGSHKGKWCPGPDCNYAVFSSNGEEGNVTCKCLHRFCWNCLGEAHSPVHCDTLHQWTSEIVTQSENWVFANTITCPKCKTAAAQTVTSLFDYERCNVCTYVYCSDCGADWYNNEMEGVWNHKCNGDNGLRSLTKKSLEKHNHYYERWSICESNRANALTDLKLLKDLLLERLCEVFDISPKDFDFVVEALLQVIECWQFLKWTYVYGYYMPETEEAKKHLFEFMQEEATSLVERLHKLFEELHNSVDGDPIVQLLEFRIKLMKLTRVVRDYFDHFMEGLYCGLPEVVSIPPFRPRLKRQQGGIGSEPALMPRLSPMDQDMSDSNPVSSANSSDWLFTPNTASVLPERDPMSEKKNQ